MTWFGRDTGIFTIVCFERVLDTYLGQHHVLDRLSSQNHGPNVQEAFSSSTFLLITRSDKSDIQIMPTLKQVTCSVECDNTVRLREHGTLYSDGFVSTYIVVPPQPTKFSIHVTSEGFIARGLAIYVFIDGVPQCNRNRTDLLYPCAGLKKSDYEVKFRIRQKEEKLADGKWVAREWTFADLNIGKITSRMNNILMKLNFDSYC